MIMIIVTMRGAIREFFYNLLTAPRTVSNMYAQVARTQSNGNHVQHIGSLSRAACVSHRARRDIDEHIGQISICFLVQVFTATIINGKDRAAEVDSAEEREVR